MVSRDGINSATITVLEKGTVWVVPCREILDLTEQDTQVPASILDGWQQFCKEKAPFCSNSAETGVF